jgi:ankyrin repeat protein
MRTVPFEIFMAGQRQSPTAEQQSTIGNIRGTISQYEDLIPLEQTISVRANRTDLEKFLLAMAFLLSNNLSCHDVAKDLMMTWIQSQDNLSLFTRLLSTAGTTFDAIKDNVFSISVRNGNTNVVTALLNAGVHPDHILYDEIGDRQVRELQTALGIACEKRDIGLVKVLLAAGADVNKSLDGGQPVNRGFSPLSLAISGPSRGYWHHSESQDLLALQIVKVLIKAGAEFKSSSVVRAVVRGNEELVYYLLDEGADPNGTDENGSMALQCNFSGIWLLGLEKASRLIQRLVKAGANPNPPPREYNDTALDHAAKKGCLEIFEFLHESGAQPTRNTLRLATEGGNLDIVRLAIQFGAKEACPKGEYDKYCLVIAIQTKNQELFQLLFDSKAACRHGSVLVDSIQKATEAQMDTAMWQLFKASKLCRDFTRHLSKAVEAAVGVNNLALFKALLDAGAETDAYTLVQAIKSKASSIIPLLLDNEVEMNLDEDLKITIPEDTDDILFYDSCSEVDYSDDSDEGDELTPLEAAAESGDRTLILRVLEHGALSNSGRALTYVMRHKDHSLVSMLLDAGSRVNVGPRCTYISPLQAAVQTGEADIIQELLDRGADVNGTSSKSQMPPLQIALERKSYDLVPILLNAGADINHPLAKLNGLSALTLAIKNMDSSMVDFLLGNGADPDDSAALNAAVLNKSVQFVEKLLMALSWRHPTCRKGFGCEALHTAISYGNTGLIDLLLSYGVDINLRYRSRTALGVAIETAGYKEQHIDTTIIRKILMMGANPNICVQMSDHNDRKFPDQTALLSAIMIEQNALIQLLIEHGANVNEPARGRIMRTPLQAACENDNMRAIQFLLSHGAEVNAPPARQNGATALQFAAICGNVNMATLLLNNGADVDAPAATVDGRTALEGAAEHGRIDMLRLLLNAGASITGAGNTQYERSLELVKKNRNIHVKRVLEEFAAQLVEGD